MVNARQLLPGDRRDLPLGAPSARRITLFLLHFSWLPAWPGACEGRWPARAGLGDLWTSRPTPLPIYSEDRQRGPRTRDPYLPIAAGEALKTISQQHPKLPSRRRAPNLRRAKPRPRAQTL